MLLSTTFALLLSLVFPTCTSDTKGIYFACYDRADKGRSYIGLHSVTVSGARCLPHKGSNFCRNFNESEERPLCLVSDQRKICKVDECDGVSISLSSANITSSDVKDNHIAPGLAVDGNLIYDNQNCFYSALNERSAWWKVDLGKEIVTSAVAFQLLVPANESRPRTVLVKVFIKDGNFQACGNAVTEFESPISIVYRSCGSTGIRGRYVDIESLMNNHNKSILNLCEVQGNRVERQPCKWNELLWEKNDTFSVVGKGETLQVKCKDGYWPKQVQNLRCNPSGEWSHFSCKKVGILPWRTVGATARMRPSALENTTVASKAIDEVIPHAIRRATAKECKYPIADDSKGCRVVGNKEKFYSSEKVTIARARGYCIPERNKLKCSSDGTWIPRVPECKLIRCHAPLHGQMHNRSGDFLVGDRATFSCDSGYDLNRNRTLSNYATRCTQPGNRKQCDGVWSPKKPCCTPRSCDDPNTSNFKNGSIIGDAYFYPETIKLNCWEGYELVGDTSLFQCNHEGIWVEINESQIEDHAVYVVSQRVNDERKHAKECFGSENIVTLPKVTNIRSFPTCEPKNCGRPAVHENCTASGNYFQYQGMVSYGRKPGFCLNGSDKIFCTASGVWSNTSPVCKRIKCPSLKQPWHGRIIFERTEYYVDDQADFICDPGYDLNMDRSIQSLTLRCQQSNDIFQCQGSWSKPPPCCIPKACPNPENSNFRNGTIKGDSYFFPERISLECKEGHRLTHGGPVYQCSETGTWVHIPNPSPENDTIVKSRINAEKAKTESCSSVLSWARMPGRAILPTCQPVNCEKPIVPQNGSLFGNYYQYPGRATFSCNSGFCLQGAILTACNSTGQWSNPSPTCQHVVCPELAVGANMQIKRPDERFVGSTARYYPNIGYYLIGSPYTSCFQTDDTRNCQGYWFPSQPTAEQKNCGDPGPIKNGYYSLLKYTIIVGADVQYSCLHGYELKDGNQTRTCLHTGQWSGIRPRCQHVCVDVSPKCSSSQTCVVNREGKGELQRIRCPSDFSPVCATDTKTYDNKCQMKITGYEKNGKSNGIEVARPGQCHFGELNVGNCLDSRPQPPLGEMCRAYLYLYFYNNETRRCEQYVHGQCYKGNNVFYTEEECESKCVKRNPCSWEMDPGLCAVPQQRFFYNITEGSCKEFTYHGCYGNQNNFPSQSECEMECAGYSLTTNQSVKLNAHRMVSERCCPNVIKNPCSADLILDVDPSEKEIKVGRIMVGIRFAPKTLVGGRPKAYRNIRWISLPKVASEVEGCSMSCPSFHANGKYFVLVRNVRQVSAVLVSAENYYVISYKRGMRETLFEGLKNCTGRS